MVDDSKTRSGRSARAPASRSARASLRAPSDAASDRGIKKPDDVTFKKWADDSLATVRSRKTAPSLRKLTASAAIVRFCTSLNIDRRAAPGAPAPLRNLLLALLFTAPEPEPGLVGRFVGLLCAGDAAAARLTCAAPPPPAASSGSVSMSARTARCRRHRIAATSGVGA